MAVLPEFKDFPTVLRVTKSQYMGVVKHIRDGDTFDALIADRRGGFFLPGIRLRNVKADELTSADPYVKERAILQREYLRSILPLDTPVRLDYYYLDQYRRWVCDVEVVLNGWPVSLNQHLVEAGMAKRALVPRLLNAWEDDDGK